MIKQCLIFATPTILALCLTGCNPPGCTDKKAENYDSKAKKDNGSCRYPQPAQGTGLVQTVLKQPLNAGFEEAESSISGAQSWVGTMTHEPLSCAIYGTSGPPPPAWRKTGTSFMPTNGVWYMNFDGSYYNNYNRISETMYQDNVDLRNAKTMLFDYSVEGTIPQGGSASVTILFTSSGTTTLWTKQFTGATGAPKVEKLGESVSLPTFTQPGRLIIMVKRQCDIQGLSLTFALDNLRLQQ